MVSTHFYGPYMHFCLRLILATLRASLPIAMAVLRKNADTATRILEVVISIYIYGYMWFIYVYIYFSRIYIYMYKHCTNHFPPKTTAPLSTRLTSTGYISRHGAQHPWCCQLQANDAGVVEGWGYFRLIAYSNLRRNCQMCVFFVFSLPVFFFSWGFCKKKWEMKSVNLLFRRYHLRYPTSLIPSGVRSSFRGSSTSHLGSRSTYCLGPSWTCTLTWDYMKSLGVYIAMYTWRSHISMFSHTKVIFLHESCPRFVDWSCCLKSQ